MDGVESDGTFADGRGDAFDGAAADVSGGEDAWHARPQQQREALYVALRHQIRVQAPQLRSHKQTDHPTNRHEQPEGQVAAPLHLAGDHEHAARDGPDYGSQEHCQGGVWPEAFLLTERYVEHYSVRSIGGRMATLPESLVRGVHMSTFYTDGVVATTGNVGGNVSFSAQGVAVWSETVLDPGSMPAGASAEPADIMGSNDDVAIPGVGLVTNSSSFYPRK